VEEIAFLLSNRIPRQTLTRLMGWFSGIEHPLVARPALALWRAFADLRLEEAKKPRFTSIHDCFTRELKPGARPFDPDPSIIASPCDGIVGACGAIEDGTLFQAKGLAYSAEELTGRRLREGTYVTIRITPSMYHRFHAPCDLRVAGVTYFSGDTWNVNPIAPARVEKLYCRNERALIRCQLASGQELLLVPVAAVLVASIRLHFADVTLHLRYKGPNFIPCDARLAKGEEMGWFEHGSTIIVLAPPGFSILKESGDLLRAGEPLLSGPGRAPARC
jgi:phosphatidylserine decarboxylase